MQCQQDPGLRRPQVVEGRLAALAEALAAAATEKGAHQAAPSPIAPVAHDIALAELAMTAASAIRAGDRREAGCGSAFAHSLLLPGVSGRKHSAAAAKRQYIKGSTPVSCAPSKIPDVDFAPVRLQAEGCSHQPRPAHCAPSLNAKSVSARRRPGLTWPSSRMSLLRTLPALSGTRPASGSLSRDPLGPRVRRSGKVMLSSPSSLP